MTDLRTALTDAAGPHGPTVDPDADLARARRALRGHRVRRVGVSTGATVALAGCAAVLAVSLGSTAPVPGPAAPTPAPAATSAATSAADGELTLVANTTKQPSGFELAVIPRGWTVAYDTASEFVLAPAGSQVDYSNTAIDLTDRIAVLLQSDGGVAPVAGAHTDQGPVTVVTVAGRPAALVHDSSPFRSPSDQFLGQGGRAEAEARYRKHLGAPTLWIKQPDGTCLVVQAPDATTLSDTQIVELAEGITIKPGAVAGNG